MAGGSHILAIEFAARFAVVALAAGVIGRYTARAGMPRITGHLFTGLLAGPFLLGLVPGIAVRHLRFLDEFALGFIGFAAGGELFLRDLRGRLRGILMTTAGLVVATFLLGGLCIFLLSADIPFLHGRPESHRLVIAGLAGAILVARSPSSAIAVIREIRAKGPFTQTLLGVTVFMDVVVIVLFSANAALADAVLAGTGEGLGILLLGAELLASLAAGILVGWVLERLLALPVAGGWKVVGLLAAGYGVFRLADGVYAWSRDTIGVEFLIEPLFACMVAGFTVTNRTGQRLQFAHLLDDTGPAVYVVFFTLAGASLDLGLLAEVWTIAVVIFAVRLGSLVVGSAAGGLLARVPSRHLRVGWMGYVTQAGIGLGLAKEVAVDFPGWGDAFATLMISVIVINQVLGPPLQKWAIRSVGEANPVPDPGEAGPRRALILGLEAYSLALARDLAAHGWDVRIASRRVRERPRGELGEADVDIEPVPDLTAATLRKVGADRVTAVVTMLSDEENLEVARRVREGSGDGITVIALLHDRAHLEAMHALDVLVIEPDSALIGLLSHCVRSPSATSILLGMEEGQDVAEVEVRAPALAGTPIRDLRLPLDTLILSVRRHERPLIGHGFTRLETGDRVTVVGSAESLDEVRDRLEGGAMGIGRARS